MSFREIFLKDGRLQSLPIGQLKSNVISLTIFSSLWSRCYGMRFILAFGPLYPDSTPSFKNTQTSLMMSGLVICWHNMLFLRLVFHFNLSNVTNLRLS